MAGQPHCACIQVLTFDELGVSGHPNHISIHYGVRRWYRQTQHDCRLCFLVSTLQTSSPFHAKREGKAMLASIDQFEPEHPL